MKENHLIDNLVFLRRERGWTQRDMEAETGIMQQTIGAWECRVCLPKLDKIIFLAEFFGLTLDELVRVDLVERAFDNKIQEQKKHENK